MAKIEEWNHRYDKEVADAAKRMQALLLKQFNEKEEAKAERKKEQEVFAKELALSEKIREGLQVANETMREEVKTMK